MEIDVGSNRIIRDRLAQGDFAVGIAIDDRALILFRFEDNRPLLSMAAYDEKNECYFQVLDGAVSISTRVWDAQWIRRRLTLRESKRQIMLEVEFIFRHRIHIRRGRIRLNGIERAARLDQISCITRMRGCS